MTQLGFDGRPPQGLPFLNSLWLNSVHPFLLHLFHWTEGGCRLKSVGSCSEAICWWLNFTCRDHSSVPFSPFQCIPLLLCHVQFFSQDPLIMCFCKWKVAKKIVTFPADDYFSLSATFGGLCKVWQIKVKHVCTTSSHACQCACARDFTFNISSIHCLKRIC